MQKIGQLFDNLWDWLVVSSADPSNVSLTVKAFLTTVITIFTMGLGLAHVQLSTGYETSIVDGTVAVVQAALVVVGSVSTLVGLVRKLWLTATAIKSSMS